VRQAFGVEEGEEC
jgi:hypothetical protein